MFRKILVSAALLPAAVYPAGAAGPSAETGIFARAIVSLNGKVGNPGKYPATIAGFQQYLTDCGVRAISAAGMTRPNHPDVAARLGFQNFLPPREWWSKGAALALITQQIQAATGEAVNIRNWWRPQAYNLDPVVAGAKNGDHPSASAVDLDYPSVSARIKAERFLRQLDRKAPWLHLSLGLGERTTHVGIGSPKGRREWHYAGWTRA